MEWINVRSCTVMKFYNIEFFDATSPAFRPAFLNVIDGYQTSKWRYKMHVISNAKIDFLRFWLGTFSVGRILEGLLGKMVRQRVRYVLYIGLYSFLWNRRKNVLNTMNQTVIL